MIANLYRKLENESNKEENGLTLFVFPDIGSLVQIRVENLHGNQGLLLIKETCQEVQKRNFILIYFRHED